MDIIVSYIDDFFRKYPGASILLTILLWLLILRPIFRWMFYYLFGKPKRETELEDLRNLQKLNREKELELSKREKELTARISVFERDRASMYYEQESVSNKANLLSQDKKKYSERYSELNNKSILLSAKEKQLAADEAAIQEMYEDLENKSGKINDLVRDRSVELVRNIATRPYLRNTPAFLSLDYRNEEFLQRLRSSLSNSYKIDSPFDISADVISGNNRYHTTLYQCSCPYFSFRKEPCKHMLRLAVEVGLLLESNTSEIESVTNMCLGAYEAAKAEKEKAQSELSKIHAQSSAIQQLISSKKQSQPWLAKYLADYEQSIDKNSVDYLNHKGRPAKKTASEIQKIIRGELRDFRIRARQAEYQLLFYENLFPWLADFKEIPPKEAFEYVSLSSSDIDDDQSLIKSGYLSPEEYAKLSENQRNQLALDRYVKKEKTNWQIGIDYERYIGYLCEQEGYSVKYNGAISGFDDMTRDLIAEKGNTVVLIQCKRWAKEKTIHENHVFQLAGSVFEYRYNHPGKEVVGAFVATVDFSPVASECGELLGLRLYPNTPFADYPRIKCNISFDGEKIYHLPMDQQYDRIQIDKPGEFYAQTVSEAEAAGFRRAYRWHSKEVD